MRTPLLATLLGLSLVACAGQIDGGGGDDDVPENCGNSAVDTGETCDDGNNLDGDGCSAACTTEVVPRLDVSVDKPTVSTELGTTNMVTVTLTSSGGFGGSVGVAATIVDGLGVAIPEWQMAINPPSVTVPSNGTASAVVNFSIPAEKVGLGGTLKITTTSGATEGTLNIDSAITVLDQLTIPLKLNGNGQCDYPTAGTLRIKVGTKIRWLNTEAAGSNNRITVHVTENASAVAAGFSHQNDPGSDPQTTYEQTSVAMSGGTFDWYCHAPGPTVGDRLIQVVP
ncbi:MAG: hypothetical protein H0U13_13330 [Gemmatimonadaceae bacterium]|nr:hypothetical protein [Gemmatimonadaceae bacterium]